MIICKNNEGIPVIFSMFPEDTQYLEFPNNFNFYRFMPMEILRLKDLGKHYFDSLDPSNGIIRISTSNIFINIIVFAGMVNIANDYGNSMNMIIVKNRNGKRVGYVKTKIVNNSGLFSNSTFQLLKRIARFLGVKEVIINNYEYNKYTIVSKLNANITRNNGKSEKLTAVNQEYLTKVYDSMVFDNLLTNIAGEHSNIYSTDNGIPENTDIHVLSTLVKKFFNFNYDFYINTRDNNNIFYMVFRKKNSWIISKNMDHEVEPLYVIGSVGYKLMTVNRDSKVELLGPEELIFFNADMWNDWNVNDQTIFISKLDETLNNSDFYFSRWLNYHNNETFFKNGTLIKALDLVSSTIVNTNLS